MTKDNIILLSWDSVRADHMPFHGYERETTPNIAEMADEGLVFEDAFVSGVGTPTSFTGLFTGEHAHGVQTNISPNHWRKANAGRRFMQEALQDIGYYTGAVHANPLVGRHYGWNRGWDCFEDNLWTKTGPDTTPRTNVKLKDEWNKQWSSLKKTVLLPRLKRIGLLGVAIHAKNIITEAQAYAPWEQLWQDVGTFVESAPEPWFLWVLLVDTHHPWCAPHEYRRWDQPGVRRMHALNFAMRRWPKLVGERNEQIVNAYDNELRHADAFMSRLDGLLDERGYDPAVVFHSDHGDELGEHDDYGHAPAMWDTVTRVPLVMRNVGETGRVKGPHTLLDVGSTVLDLAGSDERLSGRPSLLKDEREERDAVYIENRTMDRDAISAVATRRWKIVDRPGEAIVGYRRDGPWETEAEEPPSDLADLLVEMKRRESPAGQAAQGDDDIAPGTEERLRELGYL